jgi:hypothetical protein
MQGTYSLELFGIFFNRLGVQHLPVMLAGFQILVIVLGESNLLLIVTELEIRDVVFGLLGRIVRSSVLLPLFLLLALLLQLLWRLLGLSRKVSRTYLPAENGCLGPIALVDAQPNCLNLQLAEDIRRGFDIPLLLFDVRQDPCDSGALDFNEDLRHLALHRGSDRSTHLSLRNCPQGFNGLHLLFHRGRVI